VQRSKKQSFSFSVHVKRFTCTKPVEYHGSSMQRGRVRMEALVFGDLGMGFGVLRAFLMLKLLVLVQRGVDKLRLLCRFLAAKLFLRSKSGGTIS